ncbi:MAG: transcription-repair coupling factor [Deltaproteobacteria bacterium HGW-Deltaproteobacteria-17]|nr:MAG: transcription-repair coupling factor [Deltaproteobacteria bacterium HGW-Deltaproteobacteria-17]
MNSRDLPRDLYGAQEGAFVAFWTARGVAPQGFTLLVTADEARAQECFFACECALGRGPVTPGDPAAAPRVSWLPSPESCYLEVLSDPSVLHARMSLLAQLHFGNLPRVLVASVAALTRRTLHRAVFDALCVLVGPGVRFPLAELGRRLLEAGYARAEVVEDEGTFAQRGQVLDVFVPSLPSPARITYFDDEIEHVHLFDAQTQKRYLPLGELTIHPVRETVLGDPAGLRERLYRLADRSAFPSTKSRLILERIEAGEDFFGMEALVPLYHEHLVPIADYLPPATKVVLENPDALRFAHQQMLAEEGARHDARVADRMLAFPPEDCLLTGDDWGLGGFDTWRMFPGVPPGADGRDEDFVELDCRLHVPQPAHGEPLEPLRELLRGHLEAGRSPVFLTVDDPKHSAIAKILEESRFPLRTPPAEEPLFDLLEPGTVTLRRGHLRRGYDSLDLPPVITEEEFFGVKSRSGTARKGRARPALASMEALVEGEPVVHQLHGVGLFRGLFRESPGGVAGDYLLLEYDGGDRLYLPVYRVSQLSPYRGGPAEKLKLDKLGGKTWTATKKKVSGRVRDLAEKLLQSATMRESRPPVALSPDDPMILSFSATFPYEETADQERAIDDVLADLTGDKPMDRLICGDVGYGKTEVALRAAFTMVAGGRQVALLAPTTLLVEQHLRTFSERMSGFPVKVAALSRFTSPAAQKETLAQVADGRVDILIGTHRLLSRDVHFARLGLLIVDEEQKFGVAQKEQFRFWKSGIDVLTLSATPIPRTLQMGLVGLREISLINTPPQERLAVRTFVAPMDRNVVREAILREHARGGQVFVVAPRVGATTATGAGGRVTHSVEQWAEMIQEWVPTVRLAVAHGQMDAARLERVMLDFLHGAVDVLVSTSIVESGLDISRANTLLVMDSHLFGLAQLYQLRGRVGRKNVRAYAYFFLPEKQTVTPEARRRLLALQRHTQLGSGFALASEDLEIRGAGEVLGAKQSGMMAQVGFETYLEIVRQVAAELRDEPLPVENDPELHLDVAAYFSEEYIPEPAERLIWYRRLALAPDLETMASLKEVLTDRYGEPEPEGELYFSMMELKVLARAINAVGIGLLGSRLTVHLDRNTRLDPAKVTARMQQGLPFTFSGPQRLSAVLTGATETPARLELAMNHLQTLLSCVT